MRRPIYPLRDFSGAEARKVLAFGMHKPGDDRPEVFEDTQGMRPGVVVGVVAVLGVVLLGGVVVVLAGLWGVTHGR